MMICKGEQRNDAQKVPDDIIHEILVRVPINSLLKLKSVSKSWNSLVKSSAFILNHLKTNNNNRSESDLHLVSYYSFSSNESRLNSEFLFLDLDNTKGEYTKGAVIPTCDFRGALSSVCGNPFPLNVMNPVGTYNGLICLSVHQDSILWNPCVRKFIILPTIPSLLVRPTRRVPIYNIDFGYDSLTNDYKVVYILTELLHHTSRCSFHVFSLLKGCWKNLNFPAGLVNLHTCMTSVVVNGALHWICGESRNGNNQRIVTFNLSSELFGEMEMPESLTKVPVRCLCDKVKYKEWFALLSTTGEDLSTHMYEYDLWVMKEYAVAKSWTKLLTLRIYDSFVGYPRYPICFTKSGPVLFGTVKLIVDDIQEISRITPFVQSLALLDRPDALSY